MEIVKSLMFENSFKRSPVSFIVFLVTMQTAEGVQICLGPLDTQYLL